MIYYVLEFLIFSSINVLLFHFVTKSVLTKKKHDNKEIEIQKNKNQELKKILEEKSKLIEISLKAIKELEQEIQNLEQETKIRIEKLIVSEEEKIKKELEQYNCSIEFETQWKEKFRKKLKEKVLKGIANGT